MTAALDAETEKAVAELRRKNTPDSVIAIVLSLPVEWLCAQPAPIQRRLGESDDELRKRIRAGRGP